MKINADIIVLGGGLVGSSVAMHLGLLGQKAGRRVLLVDVDLEGHYSSSELNAGGVRTLWNNPLNSKLSRISIDYFGTVASEIGFRQNGYFWMYSKDQWKKAEEKIKQNPNIGSTSIDFLSPSEVTKKYDFIDKTFELGGAVFSSNDGLINPNLLKLHFRSVAKQKHVEFHDRTWIHHVALESTPDAKIQLKGIVFEKRLSFEDLKQHLQQPEQARKRTDLEQVSFECDTLVNCSGPWAKYFYELLNLKPVSFPVRRQVSIFDCKTVDLTRYGMFVDPSGVYFHPEANNILAGYADPDEKPGYNFDYDGESFFQEKIWMSLYERSTHFESLKHVTGWGGLYEVSLDKSAVIGSIPGQKNIFEAHSFSGRGAMQAYASGLALSELILDGRSKTFPEIDAFSSARFQRGELIDESLLI